jgi:hypothetical protein
LNYSKAHHLNYSSKWGVVGNVLGTLVNYNALMKPTVTDYHAWLLRLWRETPYTPWRIALENVSTGERKGFADLQALVVYLQTVSAAETPQTPSDYQGES